jgi:protein arginine N-methyltransferase 1
MEWDAPYVVSRSLTIEVLRSGKLAARTSISRQLHSVDLDGLPVLTAFARGATPREVLARLQEEWELEEDGFAAAVEHFIEEAFLVPSLVPGETAPGAVPLATGGFASVLGHHYMLRDTQRVLSYRQAIARQCAGRSVVEIGCGTGLLSIFAARAGARRVVAIEESEIATLAAEMFRANGCDGIVELRLANSRDVELDEPADLIIHEIFGTDPFVENFLPAIRDARERLLRPGGRFLPYRVEVCIQGLDIGMRRYRDKPQLLGEAKELQRIYGVDMAPLAAALDRLEPRLLVPSLPPSEIADGTAFKPRVISREHRLFDLDLQSDSLDNLPDSFEIPLVIERSGTLGAVVSYFRAHLDEEIELATGPLAPPTHWEWDVRPLSRTVPVAAGDEVMLRASVSNELGRQRLMLDLA